MAGRSYFLVFCLLNSGCSTASMPDGRTREGLISGYELVLKQNDRNGDGKLSVGEVRQMANLAFPPSRDPSTAHSDVRDRALRAFAAQDLDYDGFLTLAELLRQPVAEFTCIDADRNGSLSKSEVEEGIWLCGSKRQGIAP